MKSEDLDKLVESFVIERDNGSLVPALWKTLRRMNERVEELEQAIRSFTSEEGFDLTESLFDSMDDHNRSVWREDLDKHRSEIEKLRALVIPHRPITADPKSPG